PPLRKHSKGILDLFLVQFFFLVHNHHFFYSAGNLLVEEQTVNCPPHRGGSASNRTTFTMGEEYLHSHLKSSDDADFNPRSAGILDLLLV
ncbi:MAG TPA: hypothetical protein VFV68_05800, partial [Agriterribacter sp.]|nr:hypothetical protein [Agriterribacter sp.]